MVGNDALDGDDIDVDELLLIGHRPSATDGDCCLSGFGCGAADDIDIDDDDDGG